MNEETLRGLTYRFARMVEEDAEELRRTDDEKLLRRLPIESMVLNALANTAGKLECLEDAHKHIRDVGKSAFNC